MWNIAALWIGMAVCIPTYMLAGSMISAGMSAWQALFTITLGNLIVLVPMMLNAHAGAKYGIPFPILLRSSFGVLGANVPAVMRGLVACGWFGIQTWLGGAAIYSMFAVLFGFTEAVVGQGSFLGLSAGQFGCFILFWAINIAFIIAGTDSIKWMENLAAPFLILAGLGLLFWAASAAGGFGVILSEETVARVRGSAVSGFSFWKEFWPNLTAMVAFWATLALNIPDFTRYAKSQKDQVMGQLIGLPTTMALFSFIGIAVTCATVHIFGKPIPDPVVLLAQFKNPIVVIVSLFALSVATLSTNIAANIVGPANDIANLAPSRINFKMGGVIAGVIGILIMPWYLVSSLGAYIFTWLIGYGTLLGAIGGVMIADYFVLRRCELDVSELYRLNGRYRYDGGWNWRALLALAIGIVPNIPGFVEQALGKTDDGVLRFDAPEIFTQMYHYTWFIAIFLALAAHLVINKIAPHRESMKGVPA